MHLSSGLSASNDFWWWDVITGKPYIYELRFAVALSTGESNDHLKGQDQEWEASGKTALKKWNLQKASGQVKRLNRKGVEQMLVVKTEKCGRDCEGDTTALFLD